MESQSATLGNIASSGGQIATIGSSVGDGAPHPKWEWAASRVRQRRALCDQRAESHDAIAVFWQRWAAPLAWSTAVLAALSALMVVASFSVAAMIFSVLTAIAAATVAAFQPSEAAKSHRAAATAYEHLALKLGDFEALELGDCTQQIPPEKIDPVRTEIAKLEEELNSIELSHPPVSSDKHYDQHHRDLHSIERGPHPQTSNFKHHTAFH
jgi:hypothetical protein